MARTGFRIAGTQGLYKVDKLIAKGTFLREGGSY